MSYEVVISDIEYMPLYLKWKPEDSMSKSDLFFSTIDPEN